MRLHSQEVKDRWGPFPCTGPTAMPGGGTAGPRMGTSERKLCDELTLIERMLFSKSAHKASFPLFTTSLEVRNLILAYQDSLSWMF